MVWQDFALMVVVLVFVLSNLPQIYVGFKRKKGFITFPTALFATLACLVQSVAFLTLGLYFSGIVSCVLSFCWFLLLIQRIVYGKV